MQTTCGQRNPQPEIRLNSASLCTPQACFFILTILEVVVSICWVAISIDMTEVTAKSSTSSPPPGAEKVLWMGARMSGRLHLKCTD